MRTAFLLLAVVGVGGCNRHVAQKSASAPRIAFIASVSDPMVNWQALKHGAEVECAAAKTPLWWLPAEGSTSSDRIQAQLSAFDKAIAGKASAIVLASDGARWFAASFRTAAQARIPVVLLDHGGEPAAVQAVVGTDDRRVGAIAASEAVKAAGLKGKTLVVSVADDPASAQRRDAFITGLAKARAARPLELRLTSHDGVIDTTVLTRLLPLVDAQSPPPAAIVLLEADGKLDSILLGHAWARSAQWIVYGASDNRRRMMSQHKVACLIAPDFEGLARKAVVVGIRAARKESFEPKQAVAPLVLRDPHRAQWR